MAIFSETRQSYEEKARTKLDQLNAQIEKLQAKAKEAKADVAIKYHQQLEQLYSQRDSVQAKLQEIQQASEDTWSEVQHGFEKAWHELESSFNSVAKKIESKL